MVEWTRSSERFMVISLCDVRLALKPPKEARALHISTQLSV